MKLVRSIFLFLSIVLDGVAILLSFSLSYWLRFNSGLIPVTKGIPSYFPYFLISCFIVIVSLIIFSVSGLYTLKIFPNFFDELYYIFKSMVLTTIIILASIFFYREFSFSRLTIVIGLAFSFIFLLIFRLFFRLIKSFLYSKGIGVSNACLIGDNELSLEVIEKLKNNRLGYRLVGQVVYDSNSSSSLPILGSLHNLPKIIRENNIETILVTTPITEHSNLAKILLRCDGLPVNIAYVPDAYELLTSRVLFYELDGLPLLSIKEFRLTKYNAFVKRFMDIFLSLIILLALSPIFVVIAILIKLTSNGPIFYLQERVGKDGKIFKIIKFRTMKVGAEKDIGPVFALPRDPRRTKIGRLLRRFSLDELPQLINVLKGDMSLVGPRPERPHFVKEFNEEIRRYIERSKVRPGITGWAQVHGLRGHSSIKERVKYDLYYIENWTLEFDIKILLRTLGAIISGKNAY